MDDARLAMADPNTSGGEPGGLRGAILDVSLEEQLRETRRTVLSRHLVDNGFSVEFVGTLIEKPVES